MGKEIQKLQNKVAEVKIGDVVIGKKYSELALECLGATSVNGVTIAEMRNRTRIMDKVEKSNGTIELEKFEMQILKKCVSEMQWRFISQSIVAFADDVESVK